MVPQEEQQNRVDPGDEIDLIEVGLKFWNYRKFIIIFTTVVVVLAVIYALVKDESYESEVTLYQESAEGAGGSRLSSLASQFGMGGAVGGGTKFNFKDLINSRKILEKVVFNTWYSEEKQDTLNLLEYWEIEAETQAKAEQKAINSARELISHTINEETGLHSITVTMPEASMAADIANFVAKTVADYVQHEKKSSSRQNLTYIKQRLQTVEEELAKAEENLKEFRKNNRLLTESPELQLRYGRLQRQVTIKQEVYLTLQQEKEMAQIDLVKETPVINILDEAIKPEQRAAPKRKLIVIIGGFLGGFLSILAVIGHLIYLYLRKTIAEKKQEMESTEE